MAEVDQKLKQKLEHLLEMGGGYVLDFTNAKFADFVQNSLGLDPYERRDGSKAQVLRSLWRDLPQEQFARLTIDMLEYRQLADDLGQRSTQNSERRAEADRRLIAQVVAELTAMLAPVEGL
jgi:FixJ family two-component response regulator